MYSLIRDNGIHRTYLIAKIYEEGNSQASISINFCTELSEIQFSPASIIREAATGGGL